MTFRFALFPALLFCALLRMGAPALAADAKDMTARLQKQYGELKGFSADFEQILTHRESGAVEKRKGSLLFQKPLFIRWETQKPHQELLAATGKEIWNYLPDEELAYRYPLSMLQDSRNIIGVLTGQAALTRDFEVKAEGMEGGFAKLKLYPKEPGPQMVEALIWVDNADGYLRRAEITDFYGNKNEVRFTSFTPRPDFKGSDFNFTPPKGVEIEDHTGEKSQGRKLFNSFGQ
ncbi:MAG: outer membrane lipoprotein chaperone LolA [Desulfovibrio sp.]|jgi:outer membrane lipoprotein carrier protein|nr:outer membrane lipoprotein chaperone LolA [Desulfovibrio sp.]